MAMEEEEAKNVTIALGVNDLMYRESVSTAILALNKAVTSVQAKFPGGEVFLSSILSKILQF